jgi:hypothetical protein
MLEQASSFEFLEQASSADLRNVRDLIDKELRRRDMAGREVVESREGLPGRWLRAERVNCGNCRKCEDGQSRHGPYLYLYFTNARGTYTSAYIGKKQSPELIEEFGEIHLSP